MKNMIDRKILFDKIVKEFKTNDKISFENNYDDILDEINFIAIITESVNCTKIKRKFYKMKKDILYKDININFLIKIK